MKTRIVIAFLLLTFLSSCRHDQSVINSRDLPAADRVDQLGRYITLRSPVLRADYSLFNVNFDSRSVPGASSADYKIALRVAPADVVDWTRGREKQITSTPVSRDWTAEIMSPEDQNRLAVLDFVTYQEEKPGYTYTLWVNRERGVVLIRYVSR